MIRSWLRTVERWGATDAEIASSWPCDDWVPEPDAVLFRALTVDAPPAVVFRWLCQLRVAPYSYDWIDNLGRRSPRAHARLEHLEVGQRVATIFTLVSFDADRHITLLSDTPYFGDVVVTYRVDPHPRGSRLVPVPAVPARLALRPLMPAGDLVMMHKQLNLLARLAAPPRELAPPVRLSEVGSPPGPRDRDVGRPVEPVTGSRTGSPATSPASVSTWKPRAWSCGCTVALSGDSTGVTGAPSATSRRSASSTARFPMRARRSWR